MVVKALPSSFSLRQFVCFSISDAVKMQNWKSFRGKYDLLAIVIPATFISCSTSNASLKTSENIFAILFEDYPSNGHCYEGFTIVNYDSREAKLH